VTHAPFRTFTQPDTEGSAAWIADLRRSRRQRPERAESSAEVNSTAIGDSTNLTHFGTSAVSNPR
jgi:hypothetical protein